MKKVLFLDFETSDTIDKKGKRNPSPFIGDNFLVSFGWRTYGYHTDNSGYLFLRHRDIISDRQSFETLRSLIKEADVLVAHNAKFEAEWLLEAGFEFHGEIYCTMVAEYILARGCPVNLDLDSCCERRNTIRKLGSLVDEYWEKGLGFHQMPIGVVTEYGTRDVDCLYELYFRQQELLGTADYASLKPTFQMANEFIWCLVDMERNGIHIDIKELDRVKQEFTIEYNGLRDKLEQITQEVMGDTKINLDSPEQLSWLIYSRKVKDKHVWKNLFNIGSDARGKPLRRPRMSAGLFSNTVRENTVVLKKTIAQHCTPCGGFGVENKLTKAGQVFKKLPKCKRCSGKGYTYLDSGKIAGFKFSPRGPIDVSAGGFASDKETITKLLERIGSDSNNRTTDAKIFLEAYIRYSAIGTYLTTFVEGIERGVDRHYILHTKLMQCITRTGRLSSQDPNFQNMPRAKTFPVRRCVTSRFPGGSIIEVDFKQLEFRIAVYLSQDPQGMIDVHNPLFDAHKMSSEIIECDRQSAKPHTFKPLYGGQSGTEAEQRYYRAFRLKYSGVTEWQESNINTVLKSGMLTIPSGRQYSFPGTRRTPTGYVVNTTQICNYPVQGFATADIVPVITIMMRRKLKETALKSLMFLTVHDSIVFDCFPGEEKALQELINDCFRELPGELLRCYGCSLNVPLDGETKIGLNWMDMKEIA